MLLKFILLITCADNFLVCGKNIGRNWDLLSMCRANESGELNVGP